MDAPLSAGLQVVLERRQLVGGHPKKMAGAVGAVSVTRFGNEAFSDLHQEVLEPFAAQAVIAIENARLFNELQLSNAALMLHNSVWLGVEEIK